MARFEVFAGVQPWEEQQSPSPREPAGLGNPYELALARTRSPSVYSPPSPVNTIQRQLSGDPESPPPAWKRRPSMSTRRSGASSTAKSPDSQPSSLAPVSSSAPVSPMSHPPSRRHPSLLMTRSALPPRVLLHDNADLGLQERHSDYADLPLPQPSFRRRKGGPTSSRSSIVSQEGLNSEDLWTLDDETPDLSNPLRPSAERPLDTIRRLSTRLEQPAWHVYLPTDVIWPAAPPDGGYVPPIKTKSFTHVPSLRRRPTKRSTLEDTPLPYNASKSAPISPVTISAKDANLISSAHSSSTSLSQHALPTEMSQNSLHQSRPSSLYYSRDFLSSLAPREGGYAIAAQMGNGLGAVGTMAIEDRRRGSTLEMRSRANSRSSRAPLAKSSGMRWSLESDDHDSTSPTNSISIYRRSELAMEDGKRPLSESLSSTFVTPVQTPINLTQTANPAAPSPLSQQTTADDVASVPIPSVTASTSVKRVGTIARESPVILKSKKELKLEAKEKALAEARKLNRERAEQARKSALDKQREFEALARERDEIKRKAKEEKERMKIAKKEGKLMASSSSLFSKRTPRFATPSTLSSQEGAQINQQASQHSKSPSIVQPGTVGTAGALVSHRRMGLFGTIKKRLSIVSMNSESGRQRPQITPDNATTGHVSSANSFEILVDASEETCPTTGDDTGTVDRLSRSVSLSRHTVAPHPPSTRRSLSASHELPSVLPIITKSVSHDSPTRNGSSALSHSPSPRRDPGFGPRPLFNHSRPSSMAADDMALPALHHRQHSLSDPASEVVTPSTSVTDSSSFSPVLSVPGHDQKSVADWGAPTQMSDSSSINSLHDQNFPPPLPPKTRQVDDITEVTTSLPKAMTLV